jgi:hypothetical protein
MNSKYMYVLGEKETATKKLEGAREAVQNVENMVQVRVKEALAQKQTYMIEMEQENQRLQITINELQHDNQQHQERERELVARIAELNKQLSLDDKFGDKREQGLYNQMKEDRDRKAIRIQE